MKSVDVEHMSTAHNVPEILAQPKYFASIFLISVFNPVKFHDLSRNMMSKCFVTHTVFTHNHLIIFNFRTKSQFRNNSFGEVLSMLLLSDRQTPI